jgi:hypothetical protein
MFIWVFVVGKAYMSVYIYIYIYISACGCVLACGIVHVLIKLKPNDKAGSTCPHIGGTLPSYAVS